MFKYPLIYLIFLYMYLVPSAAEPILIASRRLLQMETQNALHVYGTNRKIWLEALTQAIDITELPVDVGGYKPYNNSEVDDYWEWIKYFINISGCILLN